MMLNITTKISGEFVCFNWHVGTHLHEKVAVQFSDNDDVQDFSRIISLRADSDELEWIEENFKNLPMSTGRAAYFFGDMAKMIVAALPVR